MRARSMQIDVFIPAHPKDYRVLPNAIRSIRDFITPSVHSITVIARELSPDLDTALRATGSRFLHEDEIIPNLKRSDVAPIIHKGEDRSGWYFQQFLKWGLADLASQEHYLVVDADVLFIKDTPLFAAPKVIHYRTLQHHATYFETYNRLFGYRPPRDKSFIANFMTLNSNIIREITSTIKRRTGRIWHDAILESIDRNILSSFSEYETYGYYVSRFHPDTFASQRDATLNLRACVYPLHDVIMRLARVRFRSIAYHNYRR